MNVERSQGREVQEDVMCRITRAAVLLAICLVLVGTSVGVAAAAGSVPSHLTVGVNNPMVCGLHGVDDLVAGL